MSAYLVALFLALFGAQEILTTNIPHWALGVTALIAAAGVLTEKRFGSK